MTDKALDTKTLMLIGVIASGGSVFGNGVGHVIKDDVAGMTRDQVQSFVAAASSVNKRERELMRREILNQMELSYPPAPLRERVNGMETYLERTSDYERPTHVWR